MARHRLTGVLLVGGASRRFGSPKALARFESETLAERAWRVLGDACDERIAVGKTADELPLPFPVLDDASPIRAPIVGVVAGLRKATNELCVMLPVDCPLISAGSLLKLANTGAPAAVPPTGPLPGAYRRTLLPLLERKLTAGDYSLRDVKATIVELQPRELENVNTCAELVAVRAAYVDADRQGTHRL
jgi:molybdopterin-guanine dinucleotide biosynthesis protein A